MMPRSALRRAFTLVVTLTLGLSLVGPTSPALGSTASATAPSAPLTNLAHLNFLAADVKVPVTAAHSTYRLDKEPAIGVLWVYADALPGGGFKRVGGGKYDAVTNTYAQGAYDADDIARAAVVYLRQWQATGDKDAKTAAYQQLRGLSYLQTITGPHAGEVVLWMQPNGALNPSPTIKELPDPSDSGPSYWLARTLWALGEGYAAFRHTDREFAGFLRDRMDLAITALNRDVLTRYGTYQIIHGVKVPNWLIVDGADASSEAVLGLAAYVRATGDRTARTALRQLSRGIAEMADGSVTDWPYRAVLPWALSRSDWHAWGANMPAALAAASTALGDRDLLKPAVGDAAGFSPQLLTSTGPDNGLLPAPVDKSQIAYGADARVQGLLAVGKAADRPGIRRLAGIAAGWFFGQNAAGVPVYDPATGVTNDGVEGDGRVNPNSGAESTIHGLLTMQRLDANPDLAALAGASASIRLRDGLEVIEAESGTLTGGATVITLEDGWTGESKWSNNAYVSAPAGSTVTWSLAGSTQSRLVQPVVGLVAGSDARSTFESGRTRLGTVRYGDVGEQGNAPWPVELLPIALRRLVGANPVTVSAQTAGGIGAIDALLIMPEVATLLTDGGGHFTALLTSKSSSTERRSVELGGSGRATVSSYDRSGRLVDRRIRVGSELSVSVASGGFTIATR
jgi:hypothetical protein